MIHIDVEEHLWRRHFRGRIADALLGGLASLPLGLGYLMLFTGQPLAGAITIGAGVLLWLVIFFGLHAQRH
jgi:hypothetical protein